MFKKASPTPPKEGLPVITEGVEEALLFVLVIICYFNDACKPPLREGVGEASLTSLPVPGKR